jgi:anthranilate phosphoribosyltransferase
VLGQAEEVAVELKPAELGIEAAVRAPCIPGVGGEEESAPPLDTAAVAKAAAEAGKAALGGAPGPTRDGLVYGAALCLWHLGRHGSLAQAADAVRGVLDGGKALARLG